MLSELNKFMVKKFMVQVIPGCYSEGTMGMYVQRIRESAGLQNVEFVGHGAVLLLQQEDRTYPCPCLVG